MNSLGKLITRELRNNMDGELSLQSLLKEETHYQLWESFRRPARDFLWDNLKPAYVKIKIL